ncbi:hypothetical protein C8F04DRAFT_1144712 [Mycena alexandri]|uniref:Uncharacterized protein n=1 Tax=Mycena alexandri TaxID=1745969 RepID=A0AAD6WTE9_9AGAR|nr:hypothetical protein C8F04DRAFT_1144712 [Mycena alexandri]
MVSLFTLPLQAILCVLITLATASSVLRATDSAVPLPNPPAGSKVVFVGAADPGIIWSPPWRDAPSACSSATMRAVSAVDTDSTTFESYVASYNFRGTGIYVNLQSGDALFQISIDNEDTQFGYSSIGKPVPANCSYDFSVTSLADADHVFTLTALGPILSGSYWNLGLESLAIIKSSSDPSTSNSNSTFPTTASNPGSTPSGTDSSSSSPSASGSGNASAAGGGSQGNSGLKTTDIIAIVTSIIGAVAAVFGIIAGIHQFKKWREAKKRPPPSHESRILMDTVHV